MEFGWESKIVKLPLSELREIESLGEKVPKVISAHIMGLRMKFAAFKTALENRLENDIVKLKGKQSDLEQRMNTILELRCVDMGGMQKEFPTYEGSSVSYFFTEYAQSLLPDFKVIAEATLNGSSTGYQRANSSTLAHKEPIKAHEPTEQFDLYQSIKILCDRKEAEVLIQENIGKQLMNYFGVKKVAYKDNYFSIEDLTEDKVISSQEVLSEIVRNLQEDRIQWVYMSVRGYAERFKAVAAFYIEKAYQKGKNSVKLSSQDRIMLIQFSKFPYLHSEDNDLLNSVRRIGPMQRDAEVKVLWYWKDDTGGYQPYTPGASFIIEKSYQLKKRGGIVEGSNERVYVVDVIKLTQSSTLSKTVRRVNRMIT